MKNTILFFALIFFAPSLFAQTVTTDSTVIFAQGGQFWKRQTIIYDNGESTVNVRLLGDTLTTVNNAAASMRQAVATWASDVRFILTLRRQVNELVRQGDDMKAVTGKNPLHVIYQDSLVFESGWQINNGSGNLPLTFQTNAQGNLRYRINGGPLNNAFYLGEAMRLNNYPATNDNMIFWRASNGRFVDLRQQHTITPPTQ